jgi:hypothetical protein
MKNITCFVLLILSCNVGLSQTEEDFIQNIKVYYAKNIKSKACDEANKGLEKYPTSARIAKLKGLVCGINNNPEVAPVTTGGSQIPNTTGGTQTPNPTVKIQTPNPSGGTNSGGTTIEEPIKKPTIVNVNSGFKRIAGQNKMEWSKTLADNAVSIRIKYTVKGVGVLVDEIVSRGSTSHIYNPGTSKAEGRSTMVELIVDYGDKKVNESGSFVIENQFFKCSPTTPNN